MYMRHNKALILILSMCVILVKLASMLLSACAQEAAAPGAPTRISPQVPAQPTTPATPTTPTTPAKPATAPAAEVYKWRMSTMGTAVSPWHTLEQGFVDKVREMSGGRIEIKLFTVGELFPVGDTVLSVKEGAVELAGVSPDYAKGVDKRFGNCSYIVGSPLNSPGAYNIMVEMTPYKQAISDLYAEYNCKWIGFRTGPPEQMLTTVPIRSLEDFKGLKLRGSGPSEMMFNALGGSASYIAFGEIYTACQLGSVVGGDMTGAKGNWDMGFHEVTKYMIEPMLYTTGFTMDHYVNMDIWNSLSSDLQTMLIVACQANNLDAWTAEAGQDLEYRQKMIDYGLEVCTLSAADVQTAQALCQDIWDDLAAMDPMSKIRVEGERTASRLMGLPGF